MCFPGSQETKRPSFPQKHTAQGLVCSPITSSVWWCPPEPVLLGAPALAEEGMGQFE